MSEESSSFESPSFESSSFESAFTSSEGSDSGSSATSTTSTSSTTSTAEPFDSTTSTSSNISVYTPIAYISVLFITFVVFSILYRRRKLNKLRSMKPVFHENKAKEMYLQLRDQTDPKVNDKVLKAALIRRGSEAIRRMFKLKECESYMNILYMKGYIGDEDHERFKIEKKLQDLELSELAAEAESYKKGWAQTFFPVCQEATMNEALRRRLKSVEERRKMRSLQWVSE
ncbi:DEKNAAC105193 [Brettanomyces naardenensis]|uniref:DEKNAAC105193 n=1 Tax=Brettanomyces naardenensis TaxID=13370 RepID=A0A448YSR3_BRENA|nr:DEKNAAC105193 [Brettanomyces naardenensis]